MRRVPLLALSLAVGGCAAPSPSALPEQGAHAVVIDVPAERQRGDADCGLACLGALLRHHGLDLDDEARRALPPSADGLRAGAICDYLVSRGFRVRLVHGTLDDAPPAGLLRVLNAGIPALVALSTPGGGSSHFVLVTGFDPDARELMLMDPALGIHTVSYAAFGLLWGHAERLMLVAAPASHPEAAATQSGHGLK